MFSKSWEVIVVFFRPHLVYCSVLGTFKDDSDTLRTSSKKGNLEDERTRSYSLLREIKGMAEV